VSDCPYTNRPRRVFLKKPRQLVESPFCRRKNSTRARSSEIQIGLCGRANRPRTYRFHYYSFVIPTNVSESFPRDRQNITRRRNRNNLITRVYAFFVYFGSTWVRSKSERIMLATKCTLCIM